jgi:ABC-type phosphate/phosphonate transport system substrate-binding protein
MIANARMYSMTPAAAAAWHTLLEGVVERAGLDWAVIDHSPPEPIMSLWERPDLGLVQMCGLPFAQAVGADPQRLKLVAAPVQRGMLVDGWPVYRSYLLVRADSPWTRLEDSFGSVVGYTVKHSQSGYIALLGALQPFMKLAKAPLYAAGVGGFHGYRAGLEALSDGRIDLLPVDSYVFDLLRFHEPSLTLAFRKLHLTPPTPSPVFVADGRVSDAHVDALRAALTAVSTDATMTPVRDALLLAGFAFPPVARYAPLAARAHRLEGLTPPWPAA